MNEDEERLGAVPVHHRTVRLMPNLDYKEEQLNFIGMKRFKEVIHEHAVLYSWMVFQWT